MTASFSGRQEEPTRAREVRGAQQGRRYRPPADVTTVVWSQVAGSQRTLAGERSLFVAGDPGLLAADRRVSVIGSRDASEAGLRRAARLAWCLASSGVVVVAGLARGIDRAAHEAAIAAGGRTLAVLGTPLDRCYPAEHAPLQERLYLEHVLVSQFASGSPIRPANFILRNRVMAMLSHASVIVEAGGSSGSLSQAAETQRLGKPVFLMRSLVENRALRWPAAFLRRGAIVLDDAQQVLEALEALDHGRSAIV